MISLNTTHKNFLSIPFLWLNYELKYKITDSNYLLNILLLNLQYSSYQAFSQIGIQASYGLLKKIILFFIMLPYEFFIWVPWPYSVFWMATFQILAKSLVPKCISQIQHSFCKQW